MTDNLETVLAPKTVQIEAVWVVLVPHPRELVALTFSPHGFRTRESKLNAPTACSGTPPQFLPLRIQVAAERRYQFA